MGLMPPLPTTTLTFLCLRSKGLVSGIHQTDHVRMVHAKMAPHMVDAMDVVSIVRGCWALELVWVLVWQVHCSVDAYGRCLLGQILWFSPLVQPACFLAIASENDSGA